ncbi:hypothetical protein QWA_03040 [Alcaligenes faecalis subsp. faecalis NCIB 8687]|nr:hypothetical protein QWA_03040 [Alcaligenes faecalis subsp. faecalis NCIB 8687]
MPKFDAEPVEEGELNEDLQSLIEKEATRVAVSAVRHELHSGPMPPPKQLAMYDAALPGTAQIIRDEFQANAAHQRSIESRALDYAKSDNDQNRKVAEKLTWGALCLILILAVMGHEKVAIAVAITTVGAVIAGFLKDRVKGKSQAESKNDDAP